MSFSTHTFQTNPDGKNLGFAFHEDLNEGQKIYFLARFPQKATETKMVAESIFGAIVDSFTHSYSSDPYNRFEEALKAANAETRKLKSYIGETPDILVAFFDFHTLYLSQCGQSEAYMIRGQNMSQITEIPEKGEDPFVNILSGKVAVGDSILLCTDRILRSLTTSQLTDIFEQEDFAQATKDFRHQLAEKSEEDILVTAIGIGRQDNTASAAGFLSKIVSRNKKAPVAPTLQETDAQNMYQEPMVDTTPESVTTGDMDPLDMEIPDQAPQTSKPKISMPKVKISSDKFMQSVSGIARQKGVLQIAGAIFALFVIITGVQYITSYESADTQALREDLVTARESLRQADELLFQGDRSNAIEYIDNAEASAQRILNAKSKDFRSDAQVILFDAQEKRLQAENAVEKKANPLAEIGLKIDNFDALGIVQIGDSIYAYDQNSVVKTIRNIVDTQTTLAERSLILGAAPREAQNTITFLSSAPQIIEMRDGIVTNMGTEDELWKNAIDIQNYGSKFSYLLDPTQNQIWKYERRRTRYSTATPYNESNTDLSQAVSFSINGAIHVLNSDGSIIRFFRGNAINGYKFVDLPSLPFSGQNLKIFTSENLDFIYVLDPDNERILIFEEEETQARYKKQILYQVPSVTDFIIDDSGQKASIISGDVIYEVSL